MVVIHSVSVLNMSTTYSGVARNLLGGKRRSGDRQKSPSGIQGHSPIGSLGAKPPEAGDIC